MIMLFSVPFMLVSGIVTTVDYCDISDGLQREREVGIKYQDSEQQILLNSLKKSLVFSIPFGLAGLGAGFAVYRNKTRLY